jgi:hypothetical protein
MNDFKNPSRASGEARGGRGLGQVSTADKRKAERDAIWEQRPDLKGKSLEAMKRIMRREARLSLKPHRAARERGLK